MSEQGHKMNQSYWKGDTLQAKNRYTGWKKKDDVKITPEAAQKLAQFQESLKETKK